MRRTGFGGWLITGVVVSFATTFLSACGEATLGAVESPDPDAMCDNGQVPQAAAYDLADGSFRWASCADGPAYRYVHSVTEDAVYLRDLSDGMAEQLVALDPADGSVLVDAPEAQPSEGSASGPEGAFGIDVDGFTVTGGQEGPLVVFDADGNQLWTRPGTWVYDDVWAINAGAVFAIERDVPDADDEAVYVGFGTAPSGGD